jgi:hypothetical protein
MKAIVYERYGLDAVELREIPQPEVGDDRCSSASVLRLAAPLPELQAARLQKVLRADCSPCPTEHVGSVTFFPTSEVRGHLR